MAIVQTLGGGAIVNLINGTTTTGPSANVVQRRGDANSLRPSLARIVTTIGATPTATYQWEASADGVNWFLLPVSDITAAGTVPAATSAVITTTTATTKWYIIPVDIPWTFLRLNVLTDTNVTNTADVWIF